MRSSVAPGTCLSTIGTSFAGASMLDGSSSQSFRKEGDRMSALEDRACGSCARALRRRRRRRLRDVGFAALREVLAKRRRSLRANLVSSLRAECDLRRVSHRRAQLFRARPRRCHRPTLEAEASPPLARASAAAPRPRQRVPAEPSLLSLYSCRTVDHPAMVVVSQVVLTSPMADSAVVDWTFESPPAGSVSFVVALPSRMGLLCCACSAMSPPVQKFSMIRSSLPSPAGRQQAPNM
mmetsp:Transcript_88018/g.246270  ORF Transcript_88018/g.246270 Transcript_88018/m.246270 type:complete len:237 (-) Transcript_88018:22-732(-)